MPTSLKQMQHNIFIAMLEEAAFSGWTNEALKHAACNAGFAEGEAFVAFPGGVLQVVEHFFATTNTQMLEALEKIDLSDLRIRDRIATAVLTRLALLESHKPAIAQLSSYYAMPTHLPQATTHAAQVANHMWNACGDTSTDFNYYTKRTLLAGVYSSTLLFWISDESPNHTHTEAFLHRRIENVMQFGKAKHNITSALSNLFNKFAV